MDHPEGAKEVSNVRLGFDRRVRLEFHGSKISSDGGLLLFRELDEVLGLHDIAGGFLRDTRTERWSQDFGPVVKVDQLVKEMIQNDETKEPLA
jgi:hypothetical protein